MKLEDNALLRSFLNDEPFYKSGDCFCLGNSLTEAGQVIRAIIAERSGVNVGVDIIRTAESGNSTADGQRNYRN